MLEQSLITHCAPTLAGLKTAGLFCFSYTSESMLQAELRRCRLALGTKGVRIRVLRRHRGRARQSCGRTFKSPASPPSCSGWAMPSSRR